MSPYRLCAATVFALLVCGGFTAASSSATYEGGETCPISNNGDGELLTDAVVNMLLNDASYISVKVEGVQGVRVVCTDYPEQGRTSINGSGSVYYQSFDGPKDVDTFVVGATDGDRYFSTTVTVNLERTVLKAPVVTKKMVLENKRPINRGWLTITNNSTRLLYVKVGASAKRPDVIKEIPVGAHMTVATWRKKLIATMLTRNDVGNDVYVTSANANMVTGKVTMYQDKTFGS